MYIEMREGMGQPGQRLVSATKKVYEELGRDEKKFVWWPQCAYPFSKFTKFTKEVFSVQTAWRSSSMLPTLVHGQAFRIIT